MRMKLKKVTVASPNATLFQTLVFLSFIHSEIYNNAETTSQNHDWYLLKFSEDLHEYFIAQLVPLARGR
jgi:hypothetical protein